MCLCAPCVFFPETVNLKNTGSYHHSPRCNMTTLFSLDSACLMNTNIFQTHCTKCITQDFSFACMGRNYNQGYFLRLKKSPFTATEDVGFIGWVAVLMTSKLTFINSHFISYSLLAAVKKTVNNLLLASWWKVQYIRDTGCAVQDYSFIFDKHCGS